MARLTPGKTSASGYIPPTTRSETRHTTKTPPPEDLDDDANPIDTPSRRSARIAAQPPPLPAVPTITITPTLNLDQRRDDATTPPPAPNKKKPRIAGKSPAHPKAKSTPRKPGGRVQVPVTPKRGGKRDAAPSSPGKTTASGAAGRKRRGRAGTGASPGAPIRPLPAPVNPPVKIEEVEEDERVVGGVPEGEKVPYPFVRRSLFFPDKRFTFFD